LINALVCYTAFLTVSVTAVILTYIHVSEDFNHHLFIYLFICLYIHYLFIYYKSVHEVHDRHTVTTIKTVKESTRPKHKHWI